MKNPTEPNEDIDVQRAYKDRYIGAHFPSSCAFCEYSGKEKRPLNRRGHIISGFIYKTVRNALRERNREIHAFQTFTLKKRGMPAQDGLKFKHLCDDCEDDFGKAESHFRNVLEIEYSEHPPKELDILTLKFFLSIAWRIIYSIVIREGDGADNFRAAYSVWLKDLPKQMADFSKTGAYDTYCFSAIPVVHELISRPDHNEEETRLLENEYLFSIRQLHSQPELIFGHDKIGLRQPGPAVLYVQLGAYHLLFTPAGYFSRSIVKTKKLGENFFLIPEVRDMKALGDIFGKIRSDDWCRIAYLERNI